MMQYVAKKEGKKAEQRAENDAYYRRMKVCKLLNKYY